MKANRAIKTLLQIHQLQPPCFGTIIGRDQIPAHYLVRSTQPSQLFTKRINLNAAIIVRINV